MIEENVKLLKYTIIDIKRKLNYKYTQKIKKINILNILFLKYNL